ncbi:43kDa postsynaptic protein [Parasponia andersonii]|uniref:43kDa postsynaptic protein n=1 Tax=Parasponia andersonii TaxID=3476 RepID=A0A2P5DAC4_PARAD|nr:43kDa postsynaptic protein [Parasponia andersonii]
MDLNSIFASSPTLSPQHNTITEQITCAIIFSIGVIIIMVVISIGFYQCTTQVLPTSQSVHQTNTATTATSKQPSGGLDEAMLGACPKLPYSEIMLRYGSSSTSCGCSICLADYDETDMLMLLPNCAHLFHEKCINQWLRLHPTCPICRNSPVPVAQIVSLPISDGSEAQNFVENNGNGE